MIKLFRIVFIFLLVICSFSFFEARFIPRNITIFAGFLCVLSAIIISIPYVFPKRTGFIVPVQLIVLSVFVSMIMANLSWGQSYLDTFKATLPYILWIFFFYLIKIKFPIKTIEYIIVIYGIIYMIIYFYQYTHSNSILFGWGGGDEFKEDRGVIRIIIPGGGIFFLASFIALNKMTTQKSGKWLWISLSFIGILIPILTATRQYIAGVSLIYLFHFIKNQQFYRKVIILTSLIAFMVYISRSDNAIVKGILEAQKETSQEGKDYIRIITGTYFLTQFSPDNINRVLGNGVPYVDISYYGKFVTSLFQTSSIYLDDVGIIAMYAMFGVLPVFAFFLIWFKSITLPLPNDYYYVKYYLWFLFITSLTSLGVYHPHYLIATVFALYIYQVKLEEESIST